MTKTILLIKQTSLGDVVHATAPIRSVRTAFPDAHITVLTSTTASDLFLNNRDIDVRFLSSNTVWFKFEVICGNGRSQNDYIEISKIYQNVFISNVPKMDSNSMDEARRFINMIDEFYDRNVKVIISAET